MQERSFSDFPDAAMQKLALCSNFRNVPECSIANRVVCSKFSDVPVVALLKLDLCSNFSNVTGAELQNRALCSNCSDVPSSIAEPCLVLKLQ